MNFDQEADQRNYSDFSCFWPFLRLFPTLVVLAGRAFFVFILAILKAALSSEQHKIT
jgi:hypothetical protein